MELCRLSLKNDAASQSGVTCQTRSFVAAGIVQVLRRAEALLGQYNAAMMLIAIFDLICLWLVVEALERAPLEPWPGAWG